MSDVDIYWNKSNVSMSVSDGVSSVCVNAKLDVITEELSNQATHCLMNPYNPVTHTFSFFFSASVFK